MKIRLLGSDVIEQIAAGEVVENPASVVKELVENSLDAGATVIEIKIKKSGLQEIRIIDNGSGMPKDEVSLALKRHATSKIDTAGDLYNINSLGFRGEALASISAVSKVSLTTRCNEDSSAMRIKSEKGEIIIQEEIGAPVGTEIIVSELFYNTPARLAFLKSPSIELKKISTLITGLAFSSPGVAFYLWHENRLLFKSKGDGKILDIIGEAYGNDILKNMLSLPLKRTSELQIKGFVSNPLLTRANRQYQTFLVNRRLVQSNSLSYTVKMGYRGLIQGNRFPIFIIYLTVPPDTIDVNIHPAKTEVRFHNEKTISSLLYKAVSEALGRIENPTYTGKINRSANTGFKEVKEASEKFFPEELKKKHQRYKLHNESPEYINLSRINSEKESLHIAFEEDNIPGEKDGVLKDSESHSKPLIAEQLFPEENYRVIGQFTSSYIVAQKSDALVLIDQHAAHERILYEKYKREYEKGKKKKEAFSLTSPLAMEIPFEWRSQTDKAIDYLEDNGFEVEYFGENTIIVRAVPVFLTKLFNFDYFYDLLERVIAADESEEEKSDLMIKTASCKGAIKFNKHLENEELQHLIKELMETETPSYCPHGRPVIISFKLQDLEKSFQRR